MPKKIERVLVVGAGMARLTLAISLRRQGLNPDIVERQPIWPVHGAGIYLIGNAMHALGYLHLADEVLQNGSAIPTQTLLDVRGRQLAVIDTAGPSAIAGRSAWSAKKGLRARRRRAFGHLRMRSSTG